jgi:hyperosmotically inducible periplasmic protein
MANQESEHRRIVVETPTARREEVHSEAVRYPDRSGVSGAALAAIVVGVVALAAIIILFAINRQQDSVNENIAAQQPPQTIVQQPAQQPPIIVQQPAPATQPAPVIIQGQPAPASGSTTTTSGSEDSAIQAAIDKKFNDDPKLSALGVTTTVVDGKVTLMGSVQSAADKSFVERTVRNVKGVKTVDNQIIVSG